MSKAQTLLGISLALGIQSCASTPDKPSDQIAPPPQENPSMQTTEVAGETIKKFDLNHDNKPDVYAHYGKLADPANPSQTKECLVVKEWDFNFDGKIDVRRHFDFKGEVVKDELDLDFDGRIDVVTLYQGGKRIRQDYDFNYDNRPDYWKYFENNVIVRTERDRDFNGRVDRWEYFVNGKLDRIGLDEDGDNQIDKWIQKSSST